MKSVIDFDILKRREMLLDEMDELQEEIDVLKLLLKKARDEYMAIDYEIKNTQQSEIAKVAMSR